MTEPGDPGYDPLDMHLDAFPKPGDDGPDEAITDVALAYESVIALGGWDQRPQILWIRHPPGGAPLIGQAPGPRALLQAGHTAEAATALAQTLARIGDTAAQIIPEDIAAVALMHEAWAIPRPVGVTEEELAHLKLLRATHQLHTRPERLEMRYLQVVDLEGNEVDVRRTRGEPDRVEVRAWGAHRMAGFYRGDTQEALRELAAVIRRATGAPGPPPDFRTVFGLN